MNPDDVLRGNDKRRIDYSSTSTKVLITNLCDKHCSDGTLEGLYKSACLLIAIDIFIIHTHHQ